MADRDVLPDFIQRLSALGYKIRRPGKTSAGETELFLVDFSEWKLSFSNRTPLMWVKADMNEKLNPSELAEHLRDVAREMGWQQRDCFILINRDGEKLRRQFIGQYYPQFIVIDSTNLNQILSAPSFSGALQDFVCRQIPLTSLSPYQIGGKVVGSRFFGREREVGRILRHQDANFAIIGVRRIGKSSLLQEAKERLIEQGENPDRVLWIDASTLSNSRQFVQEIVRKLNIRELRRWETQEDHLFHFYDFLDRMHRMHGGRITIFLDEADKLLIWTKVDRDLLPTLRAASVEGLCRFILAGFRELMKEFYNAESPFFTAFEPLQLGPFRREEVNEAVIRPMQSLRVKFEDENQIVNRIFDDTRGHPLLVQTYCLELIKWMETHDQRMMSIHSLTEIYHSDLFRAQIINAFRDNENTLDKLLIYSLLQNYPESKEWFSLGEIHGAMHRLGYPCGSGEIDQICERLILAGALVRRGAGFQFANPLFSRTLREGDLNYEISIAKKEVGL